MRMLRVDGFLESAKGLGVFGAVAMIAGALINQLFNLRKSVLTLLAERVANLEKQLTEERENCDRKLSEYRHELRDQDQKIYALAHLAGIKVDDLKRKFKELEAA